MALYISVGRRRRRILAAAAASLVLGIVVGWGLGRLTAPSSADQATQAKQLASKATNQLDALPFHYGQLTRGEIDRNAFTASLKSGVGGATRDLDDAAAVAPWLDSAVKQRLEAEIANVQTVADRNAPAPEFEAAVKQAVGDIKLSFGSRPAA